MSTRSAKSKPASQNSVPALCRHSVHLAPSGCPAEVVYGLGQAVCPTGLLKLMIIHFKRIDWWEGSGVCRHSVCSLCVDLYAQSRWRPRWLLYVAAVCSSVACASQLLDGPDSLLPLRLRFDPGASIGLALSVVQAVAAAWALWVDRTGGETPANPLCLRCGRNPADSGTGTCPESGEADLLQNTRRHGEQNSPS